MQRNIVLYSTILTPSVGAGILAIAGMGGDMPPLIAFVDVRAVVTDRRSSGIRALARDAIVACFVN